MRQAELLEYRGAQYTWRLCHMHSFNSGRCEAGLGCPWPASVHDGCLVNSAE